MPKPEDKRDKESQLHTSLTHQGKLHRWQVALSSSLIPKNNEETC